MKFDYDLVEKDSILYFWYPVIRLTTATRKEEEKKLRDQEALYGRTFNYDRHGVLLKVLGKAKAPQIGFVIWCEDRWGRRYEVREETLIQRKSMSRLKLMEYSDFPPFQPICPLCEKYVPRDQKKCSCGFMERTDEEME